jgi:hypothetical protein
MHHSPFFWVSAFFILLAMLIYVTTNNLAFWPGKQAQQPVPALAPWPECANSRSKTKPWERGRIAFGDRPLRSKTIGAVTVPSTSPTSTWP